MIARKIAAASIAGTAAAMLIAWQAPLSSAGAKDEPKPDADAVWNYLQKQDYRKAFRFFPGKEALYKGQEPHGALLTTYVNDVALKALSKKAQTMPGGSIIVKENYTPDKKLAAVTVMYKSAGYAPESSDWFWLKRLPDGKVDASGKVDSCIACHRASKRDFIMTPLP